MALPTTPKAPTINAVLFATAHNPDQSIPWLVQIISIERQYPRQPPHRRRRTDMRTVAISEAREVEVKRAGGTGRRIDYIGSPGIIDANPQAFLVDRLYPEARIDPHFHDIDQFQVVVDGFCSMGKKAAAPVTFQYADAFTPYGPIVGGTEGFAFFTLRPIASGGFFAMPGNRHNMPGRAGRNIAGRFDTTRPRPPAGTVIREELMADQEDGAMALGLRLGTDAETTGPASDAGGQYYLICEGEVRLDSRHLPRRSLIHVAAGEAPPVLRAGALGAEVLILQFARPTARPGSDPSVLAARDPNAYMRRPEGSGR
jgi:hypothetical protein